MKNTLNKEKYSYTFREEEDKIKNDYNVLQEVLIIIFRYIDIM